MDKNDFQSLGDILGKNLFAEPIERTETGWVPTGFNSLDGLTGGLPEGELVILASRPAVGKTSFAMNITANLTLRYELPVAFFTMEMSKEQVMERLVCAEAKLNTMLFRKNIFPVHKLELIRKAGDRFSKAPLYINDSPYLTPEEIARKAKVLKARHGILGAVVIDYLQLLEFENHLSSYEEITGACSFFKKMAGELESPVILLCQLPRVTENRDDKRPLLSDLAFVGDIESYSGSVIFVYRDDYYNPNQAEIIVAKNKNNVKGTVKLCFEPAFTKFS